MTNQNDEFFLRNSELSIEFSKYVVEHPELDALISKDQVIIFLPEYDPALREFNMKMAKDIESEGSKVMYVKVQQMSPKISSRLVGVQVG